MLSLIMLAHVATGQIPLATEAELPNGQKVEVAADELTYEPSTERVITRGHVLLKTEGLTLRADEVVYDQAEQKAWARGNVMFVSGLMAAVAEEVTIDLQSLEAHVKGGLFLRKRNVTEEQLLAARTPQELKKTGETVLTITGTRIKRVAENEFLVDDLSFTPCDCDPTEPSWRVEAASANVELGERAILTWPVVYIYRVPVFALPWLYLPLAERRTGLLIPRPNFSALNGVSLEQPVFVTLGDSYDLTLTPGWYFGNPLSPYGIKGGRLHNEFRYVPSEQTRGRATVGLLYDLKDRRDPTKPAESLERPRGLRGEASLQHVQDMGAGWLNRVDAGFVSDGYYFRDVTADVLARQSEYLRSTAVLLHRDTMSWFGIDAVVRQPIHTDAPDKQFGFDVFRQNVTDDGTPIRAPETFARLPAITWAMPTRALAGPVWGGFRAEYTRLSPVMSTYGDEGVDGIYGTAEHRDPTQGNQQFDPAIGELPGEREARDRIDLNPSVSLPVGGRFARLTPYLSWRQTLYYGEVTGNFSHRGYPLGGARLETKLERTFGTPQDGVRHAVTPAVEMRYVPFVFGGVPGQSYDEIDHAVPGDGLWQAVAEVRQEVGIKTAGAYRELLRLDVGQGVDLRSRTLADTYARASVKEGIFLGSAVARYDIPRRLISQISANIVVDAGGGTALWLGYDNLLDVGSDPLRKGIDALVGRPLSRVDSTVPAAQGVPADFRRAQQLVGGARTILPFGLGLRYEAIVQPAALQKLPQQIVGVSYGPGCDCWRLEVYGVLRPVPVGPDGPISEGFLGSGLMTPDFGASLSIHQFGHFGT